MNTRQKPLAAEAGNRITEGVIWKQLLLFFFPILLGTFFQQLYNAADAMIVGRFVGKEALSAVGGGTGTIIQVLVGFFVGLSSGATVVISQYYGAKRAEMVEYAVHTAVAFSLAAGALMMIAGIVAAPAVLEAMDTPADVLEPSIIYIRIFRNPAGSGRFQEAFVFSDRKLYDEYCAGSSLRSGLSYGGGRSCRCYHHLTGFERGISNLGADEDKGYVQA